MYATFNNFGIEMTLKEAQSASHSGSCDNDANDLLQLPKIKRQLAKIPDDKLIAELSEYGVWDEIELANRQDNEQRIIWLAAGSITEDEYERRNN